MTEDTKYLPFSGSAFVGVEEVMVFYRKPDGRIGAKWINTLSPVDHAVGTHHRSDDLMAELAKIIKEDSMTDHPQFTGDLGKIAAILVADGFRLGRGVYPSSIGPWGTLEITRPDAPDWEGAWSVVGEHEDEVETAALLLVRAWREWREEQ